MRTRTTSGLVHAGTLAALVLVSVKPAAALDHYLFVNDGQWTNPSAWSPSSVPTAADLVTIGHTDYASPGTCTVDTAGSVCSAVYVGHSGEAEGMLRITSGDITPGSGFSAIGDSARG
ncbi:MAG: hypothetical protein HN341_14245, partial [Verrucomicrobia bacterium]|nr:hypothetical protein [Verrucomicrobiota bacterium]